MKRQGIFAKEEEDTHICPSWVREYDVTWRSQSTCSRDSMPLGDGDTGYNVWVEKDNGLYMLIGRSDTDQHNKLGRIHITTEPNIFIGEEFTQTLCIADGYIVITTQSGTIKIWLDADWVDTGLSVTHIEGTLTKKVSVSVEMELWREYGVINDTMQQVSTLEHGDTYIGWGNNVTLLHQLKRYGYRYYSVIGTKIVANELAKISETRMETSHCVSEFKIDIYIYNEDEDSVEGFEAKLEEQIHSYQQMDEKSHYTRHLSWWHNFWNRSHIIVSKAGMFERINSQYALQRFLFACSSRGLLPSLYNGSIFRTEIEEGGETAASWTAKEKTTPDHRPWGPDYMGQNTRHQYWPLIATGDYDLMDPIIRLIRGRMAYGRKETWETMGHGGAFIQEKFQDRGFTWEKDQREELSETTCGIRKSESWENRYWHLMYHFIPTIEFTVMFLDVYAHTQDPTFLQEVVLPCADACIDFYDFHYPNVGKNGRKIIYPAGTAETYGRHRGEGLHFTQIESVTNPITEVTGLQYLTAQLLTLPEEIITKKRRERIQSFREMLPDIPMKQYCDVALLAPGEVYSPGLIGETCELYSVWPFRQTTFYSSASLRDIARQSYYTRRISIDGSSDGQNWESGGWLPAGIYAATLGLPKEARRILEFNYADTLSNVSIVDNLEYENRPTKPRFEGFWNAPHFDGIPDQCHGGASMYILQSMLLQWEEEKIYLLPGWESTWDVEFKLVAPKNTVIECTFKDGRITELNVMPEERKQDIINCQTITYQIKNMISIRAMDHNKVFGLPKIEDGVITRDDSTYRPMLKNWIQKYSESIIETEPYQYHLEAVYTLYKDNLLYLHCFEPMDSIELPITNYQVLMVESLTGGQITYSVENSILKVNTTECEWDEIGIIKVTADQRIKEYSSSNKLDCTFVVSSKLSEYMTEENMKDCNSEDFWQCDIGDLKPWVCCQFDKPQLISHIEMKIKSEIQTTENRYLFTVEYEQENGTWIKLFDTVAFNELWAQNISPIITTGIRFTFHTDKKFGIRYIGIS